MPFSLSNAGNTFKQMMDLVLGDLLFCFVNVDNILNLSSHMYNLREVILLCRKHSLNIGLPKCEFAI